MNNQNNITVGYDAKRANANLTGLGNYSRFVIETLASEFADDRYLMYIPKRKPNSRYDALEAYPNVESRMPAGGVGKRLPSLWRTRLINGDLLHDGVELFHGLSNELPVGIEKTGIKSIVTVHDLIFLRYPQFYKPIDRMIYTAKFRRACHEANRIVAVSECTKRDIVRFFGIREEKIEVIYQGCCPIFTRDVKPEDVAKAKTLYSLPERYLLNVGSLEARKNLMLIVKALRLLPKDLHLVAVGRHTPYTDSVVKFAAENGLTDRLHLIHNADFNLLPAIYRSAQMLVYPSLYEGFGIPLIEALNVGVPVVGAKGSCLEEAGGQGSAYVASNNDVELADVVTNILSDTTLRTKMIAAGKEYVRQFDPALLARQMHSCYNDVLR